MSKEKNDWNCLMVKADQDIFFHTTVEFIRDSLYTQVLPSKGIKIKTSVLSLCDNVHEKTIQKSFIIYLFLRQIKMKLNII